MLRVYLAAPYQWKDVIISRAEQLRSLGITVTSSWLEEPCKPTIQLGDLPHAQHQDYAIRDVADVAQSDILVFQDDPTIVRTGRTVEMGIAIGIGLARPYPIFVVGEHRANIFHHLPQVSHFKTWGDVVEALRNLANVEVTDKL